jgi:hypothetical protein
MTGADPVSQPQGWRPFVNGVLYQVQFEPELDAAVVDRVAQGLVSRPLFEQPVETAVAALRAAVDSGDTLTAMIPVRPGEQAARDFLRRLVDRLDRERPWPEPPFRVLDAAHWEQLRTAPPLARIELDWKDVDDRLHRVFTRVDDLAVLVLQLGTGDRVAVVDDWQLPWAPDRPDLRGESFLLSPGPRPAAEVIDAFRAATGLTELTPLPAS